MSIGGLPALNDGNNTRCVLYNRLIEQSNVQMFISAGNSGPGVNTVGDPACAAKVVSVGAYISDATWQSNYGSDHGATSTTCTRSARAVRARTAASSRASSRPAAAVSTTPDVAAGRRRCPARTRCRPATRCCNGTSMASPQAAGAAALLLSAAKQTGVQSSRRSSARR